MSDKAYLLFDDRDGVYNYCPSPVCTEDGAMHIFYCANAWPEVVIDDIHARRGTMQDGKWIFEDKYCALTPSRTDWDCIHVCDPDIIKGEFLYKGETYPWMMLYLGCDIHYCLHNQIGIAFAKDIQGPYIRYDGNPLIGYDEVFHWGVGQASAINMDGKGKLRMIYTKTVHDYEKHQLMSTAFWRDVDLSHADSPIIGEEVMVHTGGILNRNGEPAQHMNNPTIVWDKTEDIYYVTREGTPFDREKTPTFIAPYTHVLSISREDFERNEGGWKTVYYVDEKDTGFHRNHNAGLVKDPYGWLQDDGVLPIVTTVSELQEQGFLWTYRLYYQEIKL